MIQPRPLRIVAVGDLSFNGRYRRVLEESGAAHPFRGVRPLWRDADLRLGNLESPITAAPRAGATAVSLRAASAAARSLQKGGFDCVTLANDHALDYGAAGLDDTRAALAGVGVAHVGAGDTLDEALAPAVLERHGQRVGMLAFCDAEPEGPLYAGPAVPGVAPLQLDAAVARVKALRPTVDWLVVQLHWGTTMAQLPSPDQRQTARRLAEAGADLILGHHPHVVQPMEMIGATPVFYSLGTFLMSEMYWRGRDEVGDPFVSKLRLHPLSRRTGWAEVTLQRGRTARACFHMATLGDDLAVVPDASPRRVRGWVELGRRLRADDYGAEHLDEQELAAERAEWRESRRSLPLRLELKLFEYGLIPDAAEGD